MNNEDKLKIKKCCKDVLDRENVNLNFLIGQVMRDTKAVYKHDDVSDMMIEELLSCEEKKWKE